MLSTLIILLVLLTMYGPKNENRDLNVQLRNDAQFQVIAPNTEWFKRFPLYSLPTEWNNCGFLQFYDNPVTFHHALKNKLFDDIFQEIGLAD